MWTRALLGLAILSLTATATLADSLVGTIVAFDRKAGIIVLDDKTVWTLAKGDAEVPEGLKAGDKVEIKYDSLGEDGRGVIQSMTVSN